MPRPKKAAAATPKPEKEAKEPKAKLGRLTAFTSHGKRFRSIALPRHVHETLVEKWPEGTQYEVEVSEDGAITARPVAG